MRLIVANAAQNAFCPPITIKTPQEVPALSPEDFSAKLDEAGQDGRATDGDSFVIDITRQPDWRLAGRALEADPNMRALVFYPCASTALAKQIEEGTDGASAMQAWRAAVKPMLAFYTQYRARASLVNIYAAAASPNGLKLYCEKAFGGPIILSMADVTEPAPIYKTLAAQLVATMPEIAEMASELRAAQVPIGEATDSHATCLSAIETAREMVKQNNIAQSAMKEFDLIQTQFLLLKRKAEKASKSAAEKTQLANRLHDENLALKSDLNTIRQSVSWKASAPLRFISRTLRAILGLRSLLKFQRES